VIPRKVNLLSLLTSITGSQARQLSMFTSWATKDTFYYTADCSKTLNIALGAFAGLMSLGTAAGI
jgi:hypothetical protein